MIDMELHKLLKHAISENISDIHLNADERTQEVIGRRHKRECYRYASDNVIQIHAYCKHLARFDMSHFQPQTGVFHWIIDGFEYLIRFSSMESFKHKNGVLRILNLHQDDSLNLSVACEKDRQMILELLRQRTGIILFVGKTGSGKSTTMFNCLSSLETYQIYSLENPIERFNTRWIQIETHHFENALTQLLRHDPDIVVFGEVRSVSDIEQLIRAGLSGHTVVSTMHAGSVIQAIRRLCDLGASIYDLQDIMTGIIFQTMRTVEGDVVIDYEIENHETIKIILNAIKTERNV